ncbi:MAG: ATP-binding protein [Bacteroidales bacterium]|nr:ATP-binding protein [Bacteroidales bacterium]
METPKQYYPISSQPFQEIREENYVYIDKTALVYEMTHSNSRYFFLSRPRRFGKTLLVKTLKAYFEGRKELFEGLAIDKLETEWTKYPVLHFDMSLAKSQKVSELESELNKKLCGYERIYGKRAEDVEPNQRLQGLIQSAYEQTGQKAVVLIDEYDSPMLEVMHDDEELPKVRNVMRNFYSPLKGSADYLRFVFLTGITKFSQLSIFSELNNIKNISMNPKYATICGITEEEMLTQLRPGIELLAEKNGLTYDKAVARLKQTYDGYHFCWPSPDIYNPYSLLNALTDSEISNYWFGTATPHYLVEMLRKFEVTAVNIGGRHAAASDFDAPTECMTDIVPLLYQSGYLTIKSQNSRTGGYLLDIPNKEVRVGLMDSLLSDYVTPAKKIDAHNVVGEIYEGVLDDKIEESLELVKKFLSSIPYTKNTKYEGHYQSLLYVIFGLVGMYNDIDVEPNTLGGNADMIIRTDTTIYIFETKMDGSAKEALEQIDIKNYPDRFAQYNLPIVKVGINFSTKTRTIDDWVIARP